MARTPVGRSGVVGLLEDRAADVAESLVRVLRRRADRAELRLMARRVARDPETRAFADRVKAGLADGSIRKQLADQPDIWTVIGEHRH